MASFLAMQRPSKSFEITPHKYSFKLARGHPYLSLEKGKDKGSSFMGISSLLNEALSQEECIFMSFCLLSNTLTTSMHREDVQKTPGELCWLKRLLVILLNNYSWLPFRFVFFVPPPTPLRNMSHFSIIWNPLRAESGSVHFIFPGMSHTVPSMESIVAADACWTRGHWPRVGDPALDMKADSPMPNPPLGWQV